MGSQLQIPIKIREAVVGAINVDEDAFTAACGAESLEVLRNAGELLSIAIRSAGIEREITALDDVQADFVSSFPHELRIPITVIKDTVSMLLEGTLGAVNAAQIKALNLAAKNIDRLHRMNEELLELSAIAAAKSPMKRRLFDLSALLERAVGQYAAEAKARNISVDAELPGRVVEIWGDEAKLGAAIGHMIDNAVKYNREGGSVRVRLEEAQGRVAVTISDTGRGIPDDDIGKIFDKFYRIRLRTTNHPKRWGVGLLVVHEIAGMHKGGIDVKSEAGRGSAFTLTLPKDLRA